MSVVEAVTARVLRPGGRLVTIGGVVDDDAPEETFRQIGEEATHCGRELDT